MEHLIRIEFTIAKLVNHYIMVGALQKVLIGTTTLGQSGPGSNDYEGLSYTPQSSRTEVELLGSVQCHTYDIFTFFLVGESYLLYRGSSQNILSSAGTFNWFVGPV